MEMAKLNERKETRFPQIEILHPEEAAFKRLIERIAAEVSINE